MAFGTKGGAMKTIYQFFQVIRAALAFGALWWIIQDAVRIAPDGQVSNGAALGWGFSVIVIGILWLIADAFLRLCADALKPPDRTPAFSSQDERKEPH
jgi:hypothetical protein